MVEDTWRFQGILFTQMSSVAPPSYPIALGLLIMMCIASFMFGCLAQKRWHPSACSCMPWKVLWCKTCSGGQCALMQKVLWRKRCSGGQGARALSHLTHNTDKQDRTRHLFGVNRHTVTSIHEPQIANASKIIRVDE